jgi:hypothetical protein
MNECYIAQRLMNFPKADRVFARGVEKRDCLGQKEKEGESLGIRVGVEDPVDSSGTRSGRSMWTPLAYGVLYPRTCIWYLRYPYLRFTVLLSPGKDVILPSLRFY